MGRNCRNPHPNAPINKVSMRHLQSALTRLFVPFIPIVIAPLFTLPALAVPPSPASSPPLAPPFLALRGDPHHFAIRPPPHPPRQFTMIKPAESGRLFARDIYDYFAAFVSSVPLQTNRRGFKSYPDSFTVEVALGCLHSLTLTSTVRSPDPADPTCLITGTTTRTVEMSKPEATALLQHFLNAYLVLNVSSKHGTELKAKGVYRVTPKGWTILERFINKSSMSAGHLHSALSQHSRIKLVPLDRDPATDAIVVEPHQLRAVFRRFTGPFPNRPSSKETDSDSSDRGSLASHDTARERLGVEVRDRQIFYLTFRDAFDGQAAIDWLCMHTSALTRHEAAFVLQEFLRAGFVEVLLNKTDKSAACPLYSRDFVLHLTEEGEEVSGWADGDNTDSTSVSTGPSTAPLSLRAHAPPKQDDCVVDIREMLSRAPPHYSKQSLERAPSISSLDSTIATTKDSHAARLHHILRDPQLLSLFRVFLTANFCEENLAFWLDCEQFCQKFHSTPPGTAAKELVEMSCKLYEEYLSPGSPHEINIDHELRHTRVSPEDLEAVFKHFSKVQSHIFRLMCTDSVPKFYATLSPQYREALNQQLRRNVLV
ncbi:uncharacterized protein VTP21DRAFT_4972 [Calcarisporiella thermophila]|uniref:uncharacterized protein n=1 Tax=Calcarisporiella thermophila TaxID=911321 RepID=UPI00374437FD